jgi:hypothetical protein
LKFINELSEKMSVPQVVANAQVLYMLGKDIYSQNAPTEKKLQGGLVNVAEDEWSILSRLFAE